MNLCTKCYEKCDQCVDESDSTYNNCYFCLTQSDFYYFITDTKGNNGKNCVSSCPLFYILIGNECIFDKNTFHNETFNNSLEFIENNIQNLQNQTIIGKFHRRDIHDW